VNCLIATEKSLVYFSGTEIWSLVYVLFRNLLWSLLRLYLKVLIYIKQQITESNEYAISSVNISHSFNNLHLSWYLLVIILFDLSVGFDAIDFSCYFSFISWLPALSSYFTANWIGGSPYFILLIFKVPLLSLWLSSCLYLHFSS
jgi:hypothetical protein